MPLLQEFTYETKDATNLRHYANQMRKDGVLTDVFIKAGKQSIAAHRLVLSCYSKFFERMFQSQMKEQHENTVLIGNQDGDVVLRLIEFMYVGKITINSKSMLKLVAAADYLQLDEVKGFCFDFFHKAMTVDNCMDIIEAYSLFQPNSPLNHVYEFIGKNLEQFAAAGKLNRLSVNQLKSLLSNIIGSVKLSSAYQTISRWVKHDKETRQQHFTSLFKLIDLAKLPCEFLEDVVAADLLVKENNSCINAVVSQISKNFKELRLKSSWVKGSGSKIISIGGFLEKSVVEVYSLFDKSDTIYPSLPKTLSYHCALSVNNLVYRIGGAVDDELDTVMPDVYRFNLNKPIVKWEKVPSMNQKRAYHAATVFNECLLVAGGFIRWKTLDSVELYEVKPNKWRMLSPMKQCRSEFALVACNGSVYALGGAAEENGSSMERLKELSGEWEEAVPMLLNRKCFAGVNCEGFIYAIGGRHGTGYRSTTKSVERFNPVENKWTYVSNMNKPRCRHSACVLHGRIFVVGGKDDRDKEVAEVEWYDPAKNVWKVEAGLSYCVFDHSIVAV